jgi:hypothetical protein
MFWNLFGRTFDEDSSDWRGIGFALFGGAAFVLAIGYAFVRPVQMILKESPDLNKELPDLDKD